LELTYWMLVFQALFTAGPLAAILWFLLKVRPKFPSMLSVGLVVFFGALVFLFVNSIIEFSFSPLTNPNATAISIGYGFEISLTEETLKLLVAALGVFIAKEESAWTDIRLSLAFLSGLTFGVWEGINHSLVYEYPSTWELLSMWLSRAIHPLMTPTLMAGIILVLKGRKLEGALIGSSPYVTHALLDHYLSLGNYVISCVLLLLAIAAFVVAVYLLLPAVREEKERRTKFQREATVSVKDHWLMKIDGT